MGVFPRFLETPIWAQVGAEKTNRFNWGPPTRPSTRTNTGFFVEAAVDKAILTTILWCQKDGSHEIVQSFFCKSVWQFMFVFAVSMWKWYQNETHAKTVHLSMYILDLRGNPYPADAVRFWRHWEEPLVCWRKGSFFLLILKSTVYRFLKHLTKYFCTYTQDEWLAVSKVVHWLSPIGRLTKRTKQQWRNT